MTVGDLPVPPPVDPMLATLTRELPADERWYEPKWDGFRCVVFRDGDDVVLTSRNRRPLTRYFPEVVEGVLAMGAAGERFVLDGEAVVLSDGRLDFGSLMLRLHPSPTRVARLRAETPACYVAFDVLALGDRDLREFPFADRRRQLEQLLADPPANVQLTSLATDRQTAERWLEQPMFAGLDGVVAKDPSSCYEPGRRSKAWLKVKPERTADCVVGGFRWLEGPQPAVSSLLLGMYDADGALRHVGVTASFPAARRRELVDELRPYVTALEAHPWEHGFALERAPMGRLKGAAGAWDPRTMALDWVPLRPERVCEVAYDQVDVTGRWRHPTRFRRWRPDRDPRSCSIQQLLAAIA